MTLLASLEDFQLSRGETPDPMDERQTQALEHASSVVRGYCQQVFDYVPDDEVVLNGMGNKGLLLPEVPVHAVSEVTLIAEDLTEEELVEVGDWTLGDSGVLYRRYRWMRGIKNIRVVYDHGYLLPDAESGGEEDIPTLPSELSLVTMQIASRLLTDASTGGAGELTARQIDDYREEFSSTQTSSSASAWPTGIERNILDRYRQRAAF